MTISGKLRLSRKFGRITYVISAVITVTMSVLVAFKPTAIPLCIIIKLLSIPVICYLGSALSRGQGVYFYLNLGISRKEYLLIPMAVESVAFIILITVAGMLGYAF